MLTVLTFNQVVQLKTKLLPASDAAYTHASVLNSSELSQENFEVFTSIKQSICQVTVKTEDKTEDEYPTRYCTKLDTSR